MRLLFALLVAGASFTPSYCQVSHTGTVREYGRYLDADVFERYNAGVYHWENTKDYMRAIRLFNETIELYPEHLKAFEGRGRVKFILEDYRGAILDLTKVIALYPEFIKYYPNTATVYRLEEHDAYLYRGMAKFFIKDYAGSINDFTRVIEYSDSDGFTTNQSLGSHYFKRGLAKIKLGQQASGCLDLSKAGELGYEDAYVVIREHCQ